MSVIGQCITLGFEDGTMLQFEYCSLWGGFYVLDASSAPGTIIEVVRDLNAGAYNPVKDDDLKMFIRVIDAEVGQPLVLLVGMFEPDAQEPHHHWSSTYKVTGGDIVSVSQT